MSSFGTVASTCGGWSDNERTTVAGLVGDTSTLVVVGSGGKPCDPTDFRIVCLEE